MDHSINAVRRRISNLGGRLRAMAHVDIAEDLEKISNEISYFVEARAQNQGRKSTYTNNKNLKSLCLSCVNDCVMEWLLDYDIVVSSCPKWKE